MGSKKRNRPEAGCSDRHERALRTAGCRWIAGVDEVGRGALIGPVVAAAVILPTDCAWLASDGLTDSKKLTAKRRVALDEQIREVAVAFSIAEVDAETIDRVNIYQATRLAMVQAVNGLGVVPDHLLIDAMRLDHGMDRGCAQTSLIHGDALSLSIAAASVLAKVYRDRLLEDLDAAYPVYGLAAHKGYGTAQHLRALREHGPCGLHRRSFAPVRESWLLHSRLAFAAAQEAA